MLGTIIRHFTGTPFEQGEVGRVEDRQLIPAATTDDDPIDPPAFEDGVGLEPEVRNVDADNLARVMPGWSYHVISSVMSPFGLAIRTISKPRLSGKQC